MPFLDKTDRECKPGDIIVYTVDRAGLNYGIVVGTIENPGQQTKLKIISLEYNGRCSVPGDSNTYYTWPVPNKRASWLTYPDSILIIDNCQIGDKEREALWMGYNEYVK